MGKIKIFFSRVATGSFKRFFRNLNYVHKESGKNRVWLFFNMIYSMLRYGIGYLDYMTFGFAFIKKDKRLTFMTWDDNIKMARRMNQKEAYPLLDDKLVGLRRYVGMKQQRHARGAEEQAQHIAEQPHRHPRPR